MVAVANYQPGGIRLFDARTLEPLAEVPTGSKVVGIADAPGNRFVFSLFEAGAIWIVDATEPRAPRVTKIAKVGRQPYDGFVTPDGRHYLAGLFGEDGLALDDLWEAEPRARRILDGYGRGEEPLPVYKMPHLRGWAVAGRYIFLPAIGQGALGIEARRDDTFAVSVLAKLEDAAARAAVTAERALLHRLEGGCQVPIAAHASLQGDRLRLAALVGRVDGSRLVHDQLEGPLSNASRIGADLAERLLRQGARKILDQIYGRA